MRVLVWEQVWFWSLCFSVWSFCCGRLFLSGQRALCCCSCCTVGLLSLFFSSFWPFLISRHRIVFQDCRGFIWLFFSAFVFKDPDEGHKPKRVGQKIKLLLEFGAVQVFSLLLAPLWIHKPQICFYTCSSFHQQVDLLLRRMKPMIFWERATHTFYSIKLHHYSARLHRVET